MGEVRYMISEAAKRVNLETHVLRHWEEELELEINRTEMGHRYYTEDDIRLLNCIKELKEQGMLLKELKGLIPDMVQARAKNKTPKQVEQENLTVPSDLQHLLLANNQVLQNAIIQAIIKELEVRFHLQDVQEEDRYKKIDLLIRQQQTNRKDFAKLTPLKQLRKIFEV
jgi:DNA-binding transcriptional MerR regulator